MNRRGLIAGLGGLAAGLSSAAPALAAPPSLALNGRYRQGGFAFGRTTPRAEVWVDGALTGRASSAGLFVVGFDRDSAASCELRLRNDEGEARHLFVVEPGDFDIQRIDGLPKNQVSPSDPRLLERIRAEAARKSQGLASRFDGDDFQTGFEMPLPGWRVSGRFGGQRILNGQPNRPHYGVDLAAPTGTAITAPAGGLISFASTGMHFEGGLVMLDHGQGLVSMYLHMSRVDVTAGQRVAAGQRLGAVGATGRATGPHLCWRMKWRDRNLDPMLMVGAARAPS